MLNIKNKKDKGNIFVSEHAIAQLVIEQVKLMRGSVIVATDKGKRITPVDRLLGIDETNSVEVKVSGGKLSIRVYVIIRIGVSISKTTNLLIDNIKQSVEYSTGVVPSSVAVVVSGVLAKNVARRNVEVRKKYGID